MFLITCFIDVAVVIVSLIVAFLLSVVQRMLFILVYVKVVITSSYFGFAMFSTNDLFEK